MKLLITTQAVDTGDPILGFFVRWIEEFAKRCEKVTVICLRKGAYALPDNVQVISLGDAPRVVRIVRLWRACLSLRYNYDTVFVHMNPEYIVTAGFLWRLLGKRIALWYTHKSVNLKLRLAVLMAHLIFTASAESFRLRSKKMHVVGHGIDTDFFSPDPAISRAAAVLSAGRLSRVKRHDLAIRAAVHFPQELWIAGGGPERQSLEELTKRLSLEKRTHFLGPLSQEELRTQYRSAGVFVHTSETGSLDKMVLEALACGLPVVTTSAALKSLPVTVVAPAPRTIAKGVLAVRSSDAPTRVAYVREHHSLPRLIPRMTDIMQKI